MKMPRPHLNAGGYLPSTSLFQSRGIPLPMALGLGSRLNGCIQSYAGTTTKITNISTTNISTTTTTTTEKTLMAGGRSSSLGGECKLATSAKVNHKRQVLGFPATRYDVPRGSCAGYYPGCNPLLPL
jgi:hypothetical protein